jgi:hypothetical protein
MRNRWALLAFMIFFAGCEHQAIPPCSHLPKKISFNDNLIPVFEENCALPDCHSGKRPEGNLNLTPDSAYKYLMRRGKGYVDTLRPEYSLVYQKLISSTDRMPPDGRLDTCSILLIRKWIEQGAHNN